MIDERSFSTEFAVEAIKGAPPVGITAAAIVGGIDWQTAVLVLTAVYVSLQIVHLVLFKMFGFSFRKGRKRHAED